MGLKEYFIKKLWWIVAFFLLVSVFVIFSYSNSSDISFDKTKWANSSVYMSPPYIRLSMLDDLTENVLKKGMSEKEILSVLGKPDETPHFKNYHMVYWLAPEQGFISIDSSWLVIKLDENGVLEHYEIVND